MMFLIIGFYTHLYLEVFLLVDYVLDQQIHSFFLYKNSIILPNVDFIDSE